MVFISTTKRITMKSSFPHKNHRVVWLLPSPTTRRKFGTVLQVDPARARDRRDDQKSVPTNAHRLLYPLASDRPDTSLSLSCVASFRLQLDCSAQPASSTQSALLTIISPMTPVDVWDAAPLDVFDPLNVLEAGSFKKKWPRRHSNLRRHPNLHHLTCTQINDNSGFSNAAQGRAHHRRRRERPRRVQGVC